MTIFNRTDNETLFDNQVDLLEQAAQLSADPSDDALVDQIRADQSFSTDDVVTILDSNPTGYADVGDAFAQDCELTKNLYAAFVSEMPQFFRPLGPVLAGLHPDDSCLDFEGRVSEFVADGPRSAEWVRYDLESVDGVRTAVFDYKGSVFRFEQVEGSDQIWFRATHLTAYDNGALSFGNNPVSGQVAVLYVSNTADKPVVELVDAAGRILYSREVFDGQIKFATDKFVAETVPVATLKADFEAQVRSDTVDFYDRKRSFQCLQEKLSKQEFGSYLVAVLNRPDLQIKPDLGVAIARHALNDGSLPADSKNFAVNYWKDAVANAKLPAELRSRWLYELQNNQAAQGLTAVQDAEAAFVADKSVPLHTRVWTVSKNPPASVIATLSTELAAFKAQPDQFGKYSYEEERDKAEPRKWIRASATALQIAQILLKHGSDENKSLALTTVNQIGQSLDVSSKDRFESAKVLFENGEIEDAKTIWLSILQNEPSEKGKVFADYGTWAKTEAAELLLQNGDRTPVVTGTVLGYSNKADFASEILSVYGGEVVDAYYLRLVDNNYVQADGAHGYTDMPYLLNQWFACRPKQVVAQKLKTYWQSEAFAKSDLKWTDNIVGVATTLQEKDLSDLAVIYLNRREEIMMATAKDTSKEPASRFSSFNDNGRQIVEARRALGQASQADALVEEMTSLWIQNIKEDTEMTPDLGWLLVQRGNVGSFDEILRFSKKTSPERVARYLVFVAFHSQDFGNDAKGVMRDYADKLKNSSNPDLQTIGLTYDLEYHKLQADIDSQP